MQEKKWGILIQWMDTSHGAACGLCFASPGMTQTEKTIVDFQQGKE